MSKKKHPTNPNMVYCSFHKCFHDNTDKTVFAKDVKAPNGLASLCREGQSQRVKDRVARLKKEAELFQII